MRTRLLTVPAMALAALALNLSVIHEAKAASWVTTGSLNTAREYHTATLLPNGMVLVAGGYGSSGNPTNSAELYNPATGISMRPTEPLGEDGNYEKNNPSLHRGSELSRRCGQRPLEMAEYPHNTVQLMIGGIQ